VSQQEQLRGANKVELSPVNKVVSLARKGYLQVVAQVAAAICAGRDLRPFLSPQRRPERVKSLRSGLTRFLAEWTLAAKRLSQNALLRGISLASCGKIDIRLLREKATRGETSTNTRAKVMGIRSFRASTKLRFSRVTKSNSRGRGEAGSLPRNFGPERGCVDRVEALSILAEKRGSHRFPFSDSAKSTGLPSTGDRHPVFRRKSPTG
jgi:hypothetical protein